MLTDWECIIKTRLGIHDGVMENCSDQGLIILELAGDRKQMTELGRKVSLIKGVSYKLFDLKIPKEKNVIKTTPSKKVK